MKGPILCLVGPPGVGKTSLGQSHRPATNRKFVRMALGGVRDEAEIRGHRRTYIGSMPGKIVQNLAKAGTRTRCSCSTRSTRWRMDFRGDPSSALLEVLDPEQNHTFNDHYLEVDLDLSEVMFVATANSLNIPGRCSTAWKSSAPRLHRGREAQHRQALPGAEADEGNGLKRGELKIAERRRDLRDIVRYYTREAGVRNLEREIAKICRKVVRSAEGAASRRAKQAEDRRVATRTSTSTSACALRLRRAEAENEVGLVTGLAWTEVGGDLLQIEATLVPGKGKR
jgi:ATP-dependent Lon protease